MVEDLIAEKMDGSPLEQKLDTRNPAAVALVSIEPPPSSHQFDRSAVEGSIREARRAGR